MSSGSITESAVTPGANGDLTYHIAYQDDSNHLQQVSFNVND